MNAKQATEAVRKYFDGIKRTKYYFDVVNVVYKESKDVWIVECLVANPFDEEYMRYKAEVDNETGDILYVKAIEQ